MAEIVYEDKWTSIWCGDTLDVMGSLLSAGSVNMIMTSVPYFRQRNYGEDAWGFEESVEKWLEHMTSAARGYLRVLKSTGSLFLNIGDKWGGQSTGSSYGDKRNVEAPEDFNKTLDPLGKSIRQQAARTDNINRKGNLMQLPERVVIRMQDTKDWTLINKVIWHKPDISVQSYARKFVPTYEPVFFMAPNPDDYKFYRERIGVESRNTDVTTLAQSRADRPQIITPGRQMGMFGEEEENVGLDPDRPPEFDSPYYEFWYNNTRPKQAWHDHKNDAETGQRFTRGKVLRHPSGSNPGDLWSITTPNETFFKNNSDLPARTWPAWPRELCVLPILATTDEGDIVLDPFCGSGTLGVVAKSYGRRSILIDVNYESCMIAAKRIMAEPEPLLGMTPMKAKAINPWAEMFSYEEDVTA